MDKETPVPKTMKYRSMAVDVDTHPSKDVIAFGDIDGDFFVQSYEPGKSCQLLLSLDHHKKACRALRFSPNGERLYTTSKDRSLQAVDMNTGSVTMKIKPAHEAAPYSMLIVDDNIMATGDEEGRLKVWDTRYNKAVMDLKECEEFISDMEIGATDRFLLAASGEGTLTSFDIRKHKMVMQSELHDAELLSLVTMKDNSKVVVGDSAGVLNIFNWGATCNISDRFPGHEGTIDAMVTNSDDVVFTACGDGKIRAVSVLPNRFLGVVGEHGEFPVENLALTHCGRFLVSCSHDQTVAFWDVGHVADRAEEVDTRQRERRTAERSRRIDGATAAASFFADLEAPPGDGEQNEGDPEEREGGSDSSEDEGEAAAGEAKSGSSSSENEASDDADDAQDQNKG